jgi:hypothetical protein
MGSKILFKLLFIIFLVSSFFSCTKEEEQPVVYGDAIVRSCYQGDSIVYGVCFYAYSYDRMKQVTVSKEGSGSELMLDSTEYRYTFAYLPDTSEYKTIKPGLGTYIFNAVFDDGTELETSDFLDSLVMKPPVIVENTFDSEDVKFNLKWETVTYADQYRIIFENEKNEVVFQSDFLSSSQSNIGITSSSNGWLSSKQPDGGEKYKAIIIAYQYEKIASVFDLQSISFTIGDYFLWLIN